MLNAILPSWSLLGLPFTQPPMFTSLWNVTLYLLTKSTNRLEAERERTGEGHM